jgi:hypothetical protein
MVDTRTSGSFTTAPPASSASSDGVGEVTPPAAAAASVLHASADTRESAGNSSGGVSGQADAGSPASLNPSTVLPSAPLPSLCAGDMSKSLTKLSVASLLDAYSKDDLVLLCDYYIHPRSMPKKQKELMASALTSLPRFIPIPTENDLDRLRQHDQQANDIIRSMTTEDWVNADFFRRGGTASITTPEQKTAVDDAAILASTLLPTTAAGLLGMFRKPVVASAPSLSNPAATTGTTSATASALSSTCHRSALSNPTPLPPVVGASAFPSLTVVPPPFSSPSLAELTLVPVKSVASQSLSAGLYMHTVEFRRKCIDGRDPLSYQRTAWDDSDDSDTELRAASNGLLKRKKRKKMVASMEELEQIHNTGILPILAAMADHHRYRQYHELLSNTQALAKAEGVDFALLYYEYIRSRKPGVLDCVGKLDIEAVYLLKLSRSSQLSSRSSFFSSPPSVRRAATVDGALPSSASSPLPRWCPFFNGARGCRHSAEECRSGLHICSSCRGEHPRSGCTSRGRTPSQAAAGGAARGLGSGTKRRFDGTPRPSLNLDDG